MARMATKTQYTLLYAGLDGPSAAEITASLDSKGMSYEVRGDALYIDSSLKGRARMALAGEGLPSNGIAGYEILDSLSGFGTTSQMFDAAYWRAKEGELARTILASARIRMARVHIANAANRPFQRDVSPTASVTVTAKTGALDTKQAEAIRYLVAASVSGLLPEQVTVIDTNYGIILQPGTDNLVTGNADTLDNRADALRQNIERLLSARVGQANVIVEVMVEPVTVSETVTQRQLNPDGAVPITSETQNSSDNSTGGASAAVTVASNLPSPAGANGANQTNRNQTQSRETLTYDVSETVTERTIKPGDIARLSVAVLVNDVVTTDDSGLITHTPRVPAELADLQSLIESAVGFNSARGDIVTLKSMPFPTPPVQGSAATTGLFSGFIFDVPLLLQMALLGGVAIVLGLFVVRPILKNPAPKFSQLAESGPGQLSGDSNSVGAITNQPQGLEESANENSSDPVNILRDTIARRADESGHLLRSWIESDPAITGELESS